MGEKRLQKNFRLRQSIVKKLAALAKALDKTETAIVERSILANSKAVDASIAEERAVARRKLPPLNGNAP